MARSWLTSLVCAWTAGAVVAGGCRAAVPRATAPQTPTSHAAAPAAVASTAPAGRATVDIADAPDGRLTATLAVPGVTASDTRIELLAAADTDALLARLEPLPDVTDRPAPAVRAPSAPPPRAGHTHPIAFVAPGGTVIPDRPVSPAPEPLAPPQVLPVGEIRAESEIRVRFAEPMVPIAAVGAQAPAIATIAPAVAGTWRWLDTRVAVFTTQAARLPAATEFTVTVAAGVRAVSGASLAAPHAGTFATPGVTARGVFPSVPVRPDSPVAVAFDQAIDPAAIASHLRVEVARTGRRVGVRTITRAEAEALWANNPAIGADRDPLAAHHVILAPTTTWPAGVEMRVVLAARAPSREGPRLASRDTAVAFEVARPFVVEGVACDHEDPPRIAGAVCAARGSLGVRFSNAIAPASYRAPKIQIEGEPFDDHAPWGDRVVLSTPADVGRKFTITIGDGITDRFGQPLVGPRRLVFATKRERLDPLVHAHSGVFVLDPRFEIPQWIVHAQAVASLRVQLYRVEPADFPAFEDYEAGRRTQPPGTRVHDAVHPVGARYTALARVDLRPALARGGTGHVVAIASAPGARGGERRQMAWIQVTRLGITARVDGQRIHAWTVDITPGSEWKGVGGGTTSLAIEGRSDTPQPVVADGQGRATLDLPPRRPPATGPIATAGRSPTAIVIARSGADTTFAVIHGDHEQTIRREQSRWYVTDDRFTYKPGETAYVKGWLRWTHDGVDPGLDLPAAGERVAYTLTDSRGNRIASGSAALTPHGGFDLEVALPENANLGTATFALRARHDTYRHPISIEEFRTPAYAVTLDDDVTHGGSAPLVLGESIEMRAEAKYFAGGGLPGARIAWSASLSSARYRPPGWDRYSFAPPGPHAVHDDWGLDTATARADGTLSGTSTSGIVLGVGALPGGAPGVLEVDATVTDVDRQTIRASSRKIVVHPSALYVGMRLQPDQRDILQLIVTDIDGAAVPGVPVDVTIEGVLGSERHRDDAVIVDTQRCALTSASEPVTCNYQRKDANTAYRAVARVADARGRRNATRYEIPWWSWPDRDFAIVPDKQRYKPGETARLELRSAVVPATAIVTVARGGVVRQQRVELTGPIAQVELPIEPGHLPNVHVVVDRIARRSYHRADTVAPLPENRSVAIELEVDTEAARLDMRARARDELVEPGAEATFEVSVARDGTPVAGAEVALLVVDEAVLALSGKAHPDPLVPFFRDVPQGTNHLSTLWQIWDDGPYVGDRPGFARWNVDDAAAGTIGSGSGYGVGSGRGGMRGRSASVPAVRVGQVVKAREDFRATATFSPVLRTDERGKVELTVRMPDSLTRFRVVALAATDVRYFGKAESTIVTQRKVNARTVAPRFLTQGDAFSLPVVVQNLDRVPRVVDVAVRAGNLVHTGPVGKRVTVAPGQRAEVRFELATRARGRAVIQTIAVAGRAADASNIELQVYAPATTESFATYGSVLDQPAVHRLAVPADIFAEVGGVEAELASTQLQELTDAYWYLYAYPYECAEQRSGRMLATSAMYDVLEAFATPGRPSRDELEKLRAADVEKLAREQQRDGGWGYFSSLRSDPFVTMQVLAALAAQDQRGPVTAAALAYVTREAEQRLAALERAVRARGTQIVRRADDAYTVSLAAAALSAIAATGADASGRAARLHAAARALDVYPVDAKARVLAVLAGGARHRAARTQLVSELVSAIHETAAGATVAASYHESERLLLVSVAKTSALVLDALLREDPQHALVPKLARGLLAARARGRWASTQENLVVLQAMRRYFDIYEKETPSYTGKLWLGNAAYTEHAFAGRSGARATAHLGWSSLEPGSTHDVALHRVGTGRLYYRIGITYAPKQTQLPPLDAGFVVRRTYRAVDDPGDVVKLPDGRWKIALGARVAVSLEMVTASERHAVALVDPLPAGLEPVNANLANAERAAADPSADGWDHTNMRDNRSEAFAMRVRPGTRRFSYTARATTPGTFLAAPAKAEEMYSPETFGRSAGSIVIVE